MNPEPVTITLAGKDYRIRPLTLRQVRDIEVATGADTVSKVEQIATVLQIVLSRDHADELPEGGILDLEVSRAELEKAANAVRSLSGADEGEEIATERAAKTVVKRGGIVTAA